MNYHDRLDWVRSTIKTRRDNDVADCIDLVYAKIETELLGPIWSSAVYDANQTRQRYDPSYKCNLHQKQ